MTWILEIKSKEIFKVSSYAERDKILSSGGIYVLFDHEPTDEELKSYEKYCG